jgi:hypothetical protein
MALDNANYIDELSITDPGATDLVSQGDDQIRTVKRAVKQSFPSVDIAVNAVHTSSAAPAVSISEGLVWIDTSAGAGAHVIKIYDGSSFITLPFSVEAAQTVDVNAGTIDGTVIGGATPAAVTGTTLTGNTSLALATGATVTGIDNGALGSSATLLATQGAVKTYVDAQVTAQDLDVTTDSGTIDIDLDSETLTVAGGAALDTSATGTTVTVNVTDAGVTNAKLANMAANTVKVRDANSTGVPSDKALATTEILIGDGTGFTAAALSSDATMTNAGVVTVAGIQGQSVSSTAATNDQYLKYSSASSEWQKVDIVGTDKLTTKGDLLVYNTVDSETRLPVGTNDYAVVADSSATNGLAWKQIATATITDAAVTNAKMADMAAGTVKVRDAGSSGVPSDVALTTTQILIGDGAGVTAAALSGDVAMTNAGVVSIGSGVIIDDDVNASAAIDATKIADGSVTSTEFQYINTLSSNAQTQINAKGVGDALLGTAQTWTAGQRGEITALTSATSVTIDMANSNNFSCTMAHNVTFENPSNDTAGQCGSIFLTQDGTGSRTASWGTDWDFAGGTAPTLTTTAAAVDRIDYVILDATNIQAVATLNYS